METSSLSKCELGRAWSGGTRPGSARNTIGKGLELLTSAWTGRLPGLEHDRLPDLVDPEHDRT